MTRNRTILLVRFAAILLSFSGGPVRADPVSCGQTLTADTVLETNLECLEGDALYIGADGLTLDLNGFSILGSDSQGVAVWVDTFDGVTVKNGAIKGFWDGIRADFGVEDLQIRKLSLSGQVHSSIVIIRSSDILISDVNISQLPGLTAQYAEAIRLANVDSAELNEVTVDGGGFGVLSIGGQLDQPEQISTGLKVTNSTFTNVAVGILINRNDRVLIWNNRIIGTDYGEGCGGGIAVVGDPSTRVGLYKNVVTGCQNGIETGTDPDAHSSGLIISMNEVYANVNGMMLLRLDDSRISYNKVHLNEQAGIELALYSTGNRILNNRVTGNGLVDMRHDFVSVPNTWKGNTCVTSDEGAEVDCGE